MHGGCTWVWVLVSQIPPIPVEGPCLVSSLPGDMESQRAVPPTKVQMGATQDKGPSPAQCGELQTGQVWRMSKCTRQDSKQVGGVGPARELAALQGSPGQGWDWAASVQELLCGS